MLGLTLVPAAPDSPLDTCLTVAGEHKLGAAGTSVSLSTAFFRVMPSSVSASWTTA